MKLGNYSVYINGNPNEDGGYVKLKHNTQYYLHLHNYDNRRCAAEVKIDGKVVGIFRLKTNGGLKLERPSNDTGKFTFYKDGTREAKAVGLESIPKSERGLVSVTFKPEKYQPQEVEQIDPYKIPEWPWTAPIPWYPSSPKFYSETEKIQTDGVLGGHTMYSRGLDDVGPIASSEVSPVRSFNAVSKGPSGQSVSSGGTGLSGQSNQSFRTVGNLDYDDPNTFVTINLRLVATNDDPRPLTSMRSTPVPEPV
jgi:hypothetical protein